jgi:hypothetical protein
MPTKPDPCINQRRALASLQSRIAALQEEEVRFIEDGINPYPIQQAIKALEQQASAASAALQKCIRQNPPNP